MQGAKNADKGKVDAILMASGFSRRFGQRNKLLAPFNGLPLALHTLRLVCKMPQFGNVFFVFANDEVGALAQNFSATAIKNTCPENGARHSVFLGVNASLADYYAFFTCDTPLLDEATVAALLAARAKGKIVCPKSSTGQKNPAVFCKSFKEQLLNLQEGETPKIIKTRHKEALIQLCVANPHILADVDTEAELLYLEKISALGKV